MGWFDKLSKAAKIAYVRAHPKTKKRMASINKNTSPQRRRFRKKVHELRRVEVEDETIIRRLQKRERKRRAM